MDNFNREDNVNYSQKLEFPFQLLLTHLHQINESKRVRTMLWLGNSRGNGVTSLVSEFGRYLVEQAGMRVLLVDANYLNPELHKIFTKPLSPGLGEVLAGTAGEGAISPTTFKNLLLLTAGDREAFSRSVATDTARFRDTLNALATQADLVLLDGAPPTLSTESFYLASKVDGVIVVARSEKTRYQVVEANRKRLEEAGANVLGGILNCKKYHIPEWLYKCLS